MQHSLAGNSGATREGQEAIQGEIGEASRTANVASTAAAAAIGTMGMKGVLAQYAQATAMMLVACVMFWALFEMKASHADGMSVLKDLLHSTLKSQSTVIDENTKAVRALTFEVKSLRERKEPKEQSKVGSPLHQNLGID
jgi:hypothetical protein